MITIIGYLGGIFLFILWCRSRKSVKSVIEKIKGRLPPEDIREGSEGKGRKGKI